MWFILALLSAIFAALTSILAKVGIEGVNSNLATRGGFLLAFLPEKLRNPVKNRDFFGKNFDVLCIEKINSIYNFAHQSGMTYAEFNVYTFIVEFIIICLSHIFVVNLKQYRIIYMLLCIALTIMSPNFVMVWYT